MPEAVFERVPQVGPEADALVARPHSLPPPYEEVERLLRTVALRVVRLFRKQGKLDNLVSKRFGSPSKSGAAMR